MSTIELLTNKEYKYGFVTDIESDMILRGLTEDTVRLISEKKGEPDWMLEFRLKAFRGWLKMSEPKHWPNIKYPEVNYQDIIYYSAPKQKATKASLDEVDPELLRTFEKLGILSPSRSNSRASPLTPSSIPSRSRRPTKRNSKSTASSSAPSQRRYA